MEKDKKKIIKYVWSHGALC